MSIFLIRFIQQPRGEGACKNNFYNCHIRLGIAELGSLLRGPYGALTPVDSQNKQGNSALLPLLILESLILYDDRVKLTQPLILLSPPCDDVWREALLNEIPFHSATFVQRVRRAERSIKCKPMRKLSGKF